MEKKILNARDVRDSVQLIPRSRTFRALKCGVSSGQLGRLFANLLTRGK